MATLTLSVPPADFDLLSRLAKADDRPISNFTKRLLLDIESGKIAIPERGEGKCVAVTINDDKELIDTLKNLKTKYSRPISELLRIALYQHADSSSY